MEFRRKRSNFKISPYEDVWEDKRKAKREVTKQEYIICRTDTKALSALTHRDGISCTQLSIQRAWTAKHSYGKCPRLEQAGFYLTTIRQTQKSIFLCHFLQGWVLGPEEAFRRRRDGLWTVSAVWPQTKQPCAEGWDHECYQKGSYKESQSGWPLAHMIEPTSHEKVWQSMVSTAKQTQVVSPVLKGQQGSAKGGHSARPDLYWRPSDTPKNVYTSRFTQDEVNLDASQNYSSWLMGHGMK